MTDDKRRFNLNTLRKRAKLTFIENIRADSLRYSNHGGWYVNLGFWVTLVYRFGSWGASCENRLFSYAALFLHWLMAVPIRLILHVYIPAKATIGPGIKFLHPNMIIMPKNTIIGSDCTVYHDVTLGAGTVPGEPRLGKNVVVFPGAKILGGVTIGEHAHIGPNTVVMRNVKSGTVVIVPNYRSIPKSITRVIKNSNEEKGSNDAR